MSESAAKVERLTREVAEANSKQLAALANLIPEVAYTPTDILVEVKPDGRDTSSKRQHSYMLRREGKITGFIVGYMRAAEGNDMYPVTSLYMSELVVDSSWQGKGHAKRLIAHYLREGLAAGVSEFTLQTNAAEWNEPVRKLYKKFGFREGGFKEYDNRRDVIMRANKKDIRVSQA